MKKSVFSLFFAAIAIAPLVAVANVYDFRAETSQYEVPINLPSCTNNPQAFIIRSNEDWRRINDADYSVYCVTPGDYSDAGGIMLTADGTESNKRWIRWYNPNNPNDTYTHPANMMSDERAIISQLMFGQGPALGKTVLDSANYWIVDRLVIARYTSGFDAGSSHNVMNRILIEGLNRHFLAFYDSRDNVLQNSVLRNAVASVGLDVSLISFIYNSSTRIINNEMYNATASGVQIGPDAKSGHIIAGNEIYVNSDRYTDCQGNFDPNGQCACSEIGITLKGPHNSGDTTIIENNVIYGFKPSDLACASQGGSPGEGIDLGSGNYAVDHILIRKNYILDVRYGLYIGANVSNVEISENVFYNINHSTGDGVAIYNGFGKDFETHKNTIIDSNVWYATTQLTTNNLVSCNIAINGNKFQSPDLYSETAVFENNYLYNTQEIPSQLEGENGNSVFSTAQESNNISACLNIRRFTNQSNYCIPYAESSETSQHDMCFDNRISKPVNVKIR